MNKQSKVMILVGCPAAGKSSFARELMRKEPGQWKRLNNDALREAIDFSVYSQENEQIVRNLRRHLLQDFLRKGYNVIIDNVNAGTRHFNAICEQVAKLNIDCQVFEKAFYEPLDVLLERDSKREGVGRVGENVVRKWFKELGGDQFRFYKPRHEVFIKRESPSWAPLKQDQNLPKCAVFDNDGTISRIHQNRSPYDASTADLDYPHEHIIECMRLYHKSGYKIIFVSGREEKDREPTERFYQKHFPEVQYELYMRPTGNFDKDVIIKKAIYEEHIKGKYHISMWIDDRAQIVKWLHEEGIPFVRAGDPEATF